MTTPRRRRRLDRVALLLLGTVVGFVAGALVLYLMIQRTRTRVVKETVNASLGLPREAFALEEVEPDGSLRIVLRRVAFVDRAGDTVIAAPNVRARVVAGSFAGDGPIVIDQVLLERPDVRLLQRRNGEWNFTDIFKVQADGRDVDLAQAREDAGKPIEFRDLRIVDGRVRVATPYTPPANPPAGRFASLRQPERVRTAGGWMTVRNLTALNASLPLVRVHDGGWRTEIASLSANVTNPDTRIVQLAGFVQADARRNYTFRIDAFRTPNSAFDGSGRIALGGAAPVFDLNVRAHPLSFADLQGMGLPIPAAGTASFTLAARSQPRGRTLWRFSDARIAILDSRASGRVTVLTGPGIEPVFSDTRISLDPLRLADLEALGYAENLPLLGTVSGTIASRDALEMGRGGPLHLDLAASLTPRGSPNVAPSRVTARGLVRYRPGEDPFRLDGLRVEADPLYLAHFASVAPRSAKMLKGVLRGGATLSGSVGDLRFADGELRYAVGRAPETVLSRVSGRVVRGPTLRWELSARAQPLALGTLTALFPALPFRNATLAGPIRASGDGDNVSFDADLRGAAGGLDIRGSLTLGQPMRFDVAGRLEAFRAGALLASDVPVEGPLSGTFNARGTTEDFRFAVDLAQAAGRFNLAGTVRRPGGGPAQFDVAGRVDNFRIGYLLGKPGLLPGPVSGPISISGGGRQPIRFEVALQGEQGLFELRGTFQSGAVPTYAVTGRVQGLDLSGLPGLAMLPATRLTGALAIQGQGTTPETFAGTIDFTASPGSTVGGVPLEAGRARITAADGILTVHELRFALRGMRVEAAGQLGLTRPAPELLRFTVDAPNLGVLAALLPPPGRLEPDVAGSLQAAGWVGGTLEFPEVAANAQGRGIRFNTYSAASLALETRLRKGPERWTGEVKLAGEDLAVGATDFRALDLTATLAETGASFGVNARRDAATDLHASGMLEMEGLAVRGVVLRELNVRLRDVQWTLAVPQARLAFTDAGYVVENLRLQRSGAATGFIEANGLLPTSGEANLVVRAEGVDMRELRQLVPTLPDVGGTLALTASIVGPVTEPRLLLDATVDSLAYGGLATDRLHVTGEYGAQRMRLHGDVTLAGRTILAAESTIPMNLSLGGFVPGFELIRDGPVTAEIRADSLPLQLVAEAVPALKDGEGVATAAITVSGTLDNPTVAGTAGLQDAAFTIEPLGVRWRDVAARVRLEGETIHVDSAAAFTGERGFATLRGTIVLDNPQTPAVNLAVTLDDFQAIDNEDVAELQVDGQLALSGRLPRAELRGRVRIEDGTIQIPEFGEQAEADIVDVDVGELGADTVSAGVANAAGMMGMLIPRDLEVEIGDQVWLESEDARIQIRGDLLVYEAGGINRIYGDVQVRRGTYTLVVGPVEREFEIVEGTLQFSGTPELNPRLDITAEHEVRSREPGVADIAVLVRLGGTMQAPTLQLSSNTRPPLPESELLTLLILGRRGSDLAALPQEFTQGIILEQLLGGYITEGLEDALGSLGIFDYFRFTTRPTGVGFASPEVIGTDLLAYASLEAGLEVFEDAFVILQLVDIFSEPRFGFAFEWEFTRSWALRLAMEPVRRDPLLLNLDRRERQITVEARRRWEYGRPPVNDSVDLRPPATDQPRPAEASTPTGDPPVPTTPPPPPPPVPTGPPTTREREE
ncbi:MAG TPA: translocation/assembly module TamB domain-containing protein [Longimicrobium sp.]|nr:translocation/assembly module TamB domain-containing protein [Longimicrobium sp.]